MQNRRIHRLFICNGTCKRHNNKKPMQYVSFPYFHTKRFTFTQKTKFS